MAAQITAKHPQAKVDLLPGGKGDFIVTVEGNQVWSKNGDDGRFPEEGEVLARLTPV